MTGTRQWKLMTALALGSCCGLGCGNDEEQGASASGGSGQGAETSQGLVHSHEGDHAPYATPYHPNQHWGSHGHESIASQGMGGNGGTSAPTTPPPSGKVALYSTAPLDNVDGPILFIEKSCSTPDDGTCQDGYSVCDFSDSCVESCFRSTTCGTSYKHLPQPVDPCGLWYIDESDSTLYYMRAKNSYVEKRLDYQTIQFLADGSTALGADDCLAACRADEDCVGGYYGVEGWIEEPTHCRLLYRSPKELAPEGEDFVWSAAPAELNETADYYAVSFLNQGFFSKCQAP